MLGYERILRGISVSNNQKVFIKKILNLEKYNTKHGVIYAILLFCSEEKGRPVVTDFAYDLDNLSPTPCSAVNSLDFSYPSSKTRLKQRSPYDTMGRLQSQSTFVVAMQ